MGRTRSCADQAVRHPCPVAAPLGRSFSALMLLDADERPNAASALLVLPQLAWPVPARPPEAAPEEAEAEAEEEGAEAVV